MEICLAQLHRFSSGELTAWQGSVDSSDSLAVLLRAKIQWIVAAIWGM